MIADSIVCQRVEQFDARHSADGPPVVVGRWLCFADGAKREAMNAYGPLCEPPGQEGHNVHPAAYRVSADWDRWDNIVTYREAMLKNAVAAFDEAKAKALAEDTTAYHLTADRVAKLKALQTQVRTWKRRLANAQAKRDEADPRIPKVPKLTPEQQAAIDAQRQKLESQRSAYRTAIEAIEI